MLKKPSQHPLFRKAGENMESSFVVEKAVEQPLTIILEDGEDILECLGKAMQEHCAKEFKVTEMKGSWKQGFMNYFLKNSFKSRKSFDTERIVAGSGKFVKEGSKYRGDLHITVALGNQRVNGTLLEGKAAGGLEIKAKFPKYCAPEAKTGEKTPLV